MCPLEGFEGICGEEEPIFSSYHPRMEAKECYIGHVILCWNKWKESANRYIPSIHRLFEKVLRTNIDLDFLRRVCDVAILHHDIGKLSVDYQSGEFYRHEMLSAFLTYNYITNMSSTEFSLDEPRTKVLSSIISAALYLHHEALQISHHHRERRTPTYGYLLNILMGRKFRMVRRWRSIAAELEYWAFNKYLDYFEDIVLIDGYKVAGLLGLIITLIDGGPDPLPLRLAVSSILHPITISDNLAALERGGKPSRLSSFLGAMER
jgi:CRISPR/Cas system-associated endonuclease Cas3-HD